MSEPAALFIRDRDLADLQFSQGAAVPVVKSVRPSDDGLGILVDGVAAVRCVHPAVVRIESLIDEKLAPGDGAINVQSLIAHHLQFRAEVIRGMRVYPEQRMPRRAAAGRDGETVGAAGNRLRRRACRKSARRLPRLPRVELPKLRQVDAFDIAADAAFGEGQRHPGFETMDHFRGNGGMLRQEVIQSVRPSRHQCLEPGRAAQESSAQSARVDEQPLTKVAQDGRFAFRLRQHP